MTGMGAGTGWRIDPAAAKSAVSDAKAGASGLDDVTAAVEAAVGKAAAAVGPKTAAAVEFIKQDAFLGHINDIRSGVAHAADQLDLALDAYEQGDVQMAANRELQVGQ